MINSACGPDLSHPLDIYFDALPALSYAQSIENDHVFSLIVFAQQCSFVICFTGNSFLFDALEDKIHFQAWLHRFNGPKCKCCGMRICLQDADHNWPLVNVVDQSIDRIQEMISRLFSVCWSVGSIRQSLPGSLICWM